MKKIAFTLRPMQRGDVQDGLRLATAEGWNQTVNDWKFLLDSADGISLVAATDKEIIGTTTAINYDNEIAWIGMMLVDKNYRRMGVSKMLLTEVLETLKWCRSVKLDATPEGREVYRKFGFKDESSITRMTNLSVKQLLQRDPKDCRIETIQSQDVKEIAALDESIFGANRIQLINYLVNQYPQKSWQLKKDGKLAGFALGRPGNKYHYIGPVVGETMQHGMILITRALTQLTDQAAVVDVLNDKAELINWLTANGFSRQRELFRMYKDENLIRRSTQKYFLIAGPELG